MNTQLILLGAPGSGKGTQAARIVSEFGYTHISTGDLLRSEIAKESELGLRVKAIMAAGDLVSDDVVLELLKANCDIAKNLYLFDGYPRNIDQVEALHKNILSGFKSKALYFDIDLDILEKRVINRRVAPKSGEIYNLISRPSKVEGICDISGEELVHRKDDNVETVRNRLNIFKAEIEPILSYYESKGNLERIDALLAPDEIFENISKIIK